MAKVSAPLMSLTASGSIANVLTMLRAGARNIAKKKGRPGGQPSAAQIARRAFYQSAAADWSALTAPEKAAWNDAAAARRITPFNAYMSERLAAYGSGAGLAWDGGAAVWDGGAAAWV